MAKTDNQQREVYYSGRVQGVGFRYTVRQIAQGHKVTGFVKNLPDGRVQLVAEGAAAEIQAFLDEIVTHLGRYVRDVQQTTSPASGRFRSFEIRF
jgi:acylphosphatase